MLDQFSNSILSKTKKILPPILHLFSNVELFPYHQLVKSELWNSDEKHSILSSRLVSFTKNLTSDEITYSFRIDCTANIHWDTRYISAGTILFHYRRSIPRCLDELRTCRSCYRNSKQNRPDKGKNCMKSIELYEMASSGRRRERGRDRERIDIGLVIPQIKR